MRIIAGQYRRRSLQSRPGLDLRPTSDRLRETLFDVLAAVGSLSDSVWVDLYAGTGAVGIEALSRGAPGLFRGVGGKTEINVRSTFPGRVTSPGSPGNV